MWLLLEKKVLQNVEQKSSIQLSLIWHLRKAVKCIEQSLLSFLPKKPVLIPLCDIISIVCHSFSAYLCLCIAIELLILELYEMFRQVVLINQGMEVAQIKEFTYMIMILLIKERLYLSTYIVVSYATCDYFPYRA